MRKPSFLSRFQRLTERAVFAFFATVWTASFTAGCQSAPTESAKSNDNGNAPVVRDTMVVRYGSPQPVDTLVAKYGSPVPRPVDTIKTLYGIQTPRDTFVARYGTPTPKPVDTIKTLYGIPFPIHENPDIPSAGTDRSEP